MDKKTYITSLPLQHPLLASFGKSDIISAGKDVRSGVGEEWGEGVSSNHLVFMVREGQVQSVGHDPVLTVKSRELLLVSAGLSKRLRLEHGELRALWFHLADVPAWQFLRGPRPLVLPAPEIDFLDALFAQLLRETELSATQGRMEIGRIQAGLLRQYLEQYLRLPADPVKLKLRQRLDTLWHQVNCQLAFPWSVERLAQSVAFSPSHLHRIALDIFGATPMQIVTRLRLERAATLLRTTDCTLDDIARQIGYRNTPSFSDAFLRYRGQRPGAFRTACRHRRHCNLRPFPG